jgi:hypothetical protein
MGGSKKTCWPLSDFAFLAALYIEALLGKTKMSSRVGVDLPALSQLKTVISDAMRAGAESWSARSHASDVTSETILLRLAKMADRKVA